MAAAVELVRAAFEAFERDGPEAVLAQADPEIEGYADEALPNRGAYRGREAVLGWFQGWLEVWEQYRAEPREFIEVGDCVVVVPVRQSGIGRGSGIPVEGEIVFLIEIREGLLRRFHLYVDRDRALEVGRRIAAGEL